MPILVYVIALAIGVGTLALSVDLATKPDIEPVKQVASVAPVRQIPITKDSDISRGDPQNQLSPVYPAAPGKNLPPPAGVANAKPADDQSNSVTAAASPGATAPANGSAASASQGATPVAAAQALPDNSRTSPSTAPASVASTTGRAPSDDADEPRAQLVSTSAAAAPNSCAISACSSAYRSFRASDCTYQPFGGPRKVCDLNEGALRNASAVSAPAAAERREFPRNRMQSRSDNLDSAARVVRQLPGPDDFADNRERRVIVIERPGTRYAPGVVYEEW